MVSIDQSKGFLFVVNCDYSETIKNAKYSRPPPHFVDIAVIILIKLDHRMQMGFIRACTLLHSSGLQQCTTSFIRSWLGVFVHHFFFEIRLHTTNLIGILLQRVMRHQAEHWRQGEFFVVVSTLSWLTNRASGCLVVESKISTLSVSGRPFQIVLFSSIFSWAIFLANEPRERVVHGRVKKCRPYQYLIVDLLCVAAVGIPGFMISHVRSCPEGESATARIPLC